MKRYIRSSVIGDWNGYEYFQENKSPNRYYFLDKNNKIHYADLEEELKAKIDKYVDTGSITASEFIVTVGDVEEYYIEADNEDDALTEFLDLYAKPEDIKEYEDDPGYIWVRESEDED